MIIFACKRIDSLKENVGSLNWKNKGKYLQAILLAVLAVDFLLDLQISVNFSHVSFCTFCIDFLQEKTDSNIVLFLFF